MFWLILKAVSCRVDRINITVVCNASVARWFWMKWRFVGKFHKTLFVITLWASHLFERPSLKWVVFYQKFSLAATIFYDIVLFLYFSMVAHGGMLHFFSKNLFYKNVKMKILRTYPKLWRSTFFLFIMILLSFRPARLVRMESFNWTPNTRTIFKDILRTFEAEIRKMFKIIQPQPKN